jgi:hypothetical protein
MNITIFCYPFILWMQYYWDESLFYNGYEWILLYFVIHLYYGCSITEMNHYFMVDMNEYYYIFYPFILWMQYYWDESLFYNGYEWILLYFVIHLYYGCSITEMNHYFTMDMNEYYYILLSIYIMDAVITEMNHYFMMDMNEYYNILLSIYIMDAVLLRWITIL